MAYQSYHDQNLLFSYIHSSNGLAATPKAISRWKLIYIKEGCGTYTVNGKVYYPQKNDLIIVRAQDHHCLQVEPGVRFERYFVYFYENMMQSPICQRLPADVAVLHCGGSPVILSLFQKLHSYMDQFENDIYKTLVIHTAEEILCQALLLAKTAEKDSGYTENAIVAAAIHYIKSNITQPLQVADLTRHLHISKGYLDMLFRQHLKISPKKFILTQKLVLARRDLLAGAKATEVSARYGFQDYSLFYRQYIGYWGHKPSQATSIPDPQETDL